MTDLEDHAETYDGPEIVTVQDLASRPPGVIKSDTLVSADELTDEDEFPEFGEFLEMEVGEDTEYWEVPSSLASVVVERVEELELETEGSVLDVQNSWKGSSGEWNYQISMHEDGT